MKKRELHLLAILFFLMTSLLTSCNKNQEEKLETQTMTITSNAQVTFDNLRIGIGFIGVDPNILQNENRRVESVQIWPFLRNEEKGRPSMMVHEKDIIDIGMYQLKILKISKDSVKIRFSLLERNED